MADTDELKRTGDNISQAVDEAVRKNDYSDLSEQIGRLVNGAAHVIGGAADMVDGAGRALNNANRRREMEARARAERERREAEEAKYFAKPADTTGSDALTVLGGFGTAIFGLMTLAGFIIRLIVTGSVAAAIVGPLTILAAILTALCAAAMISGKRQRARTIRFKAYRRKLLPKLYADVKDLAAEAKVPEKTTVDDLERFMQSGMIRQGHFDDTKTCFIASDELYAQYQATARQAAALRQKEEKKKQQEAQYSPEVQQILNEGSDYIEMIRRANDAIADEQVSDKLYRMEDITKRIFDEVRRRPELARNLNMFMSYYLPTTTKLVNAYEDMEKHAAQGENVRKAKKEIADSLDTINDAFETLLDSFFQETAMDVSSDINVMKMMMQQDGLTPDELSAMRAKAAKEKAKAAAAGTAGTQGGAVQSQGGAQMMEMPK